MGNEISFWSVTIYMSRQEEVKEDSCLVCSHLGRGSLGQNDLISLCAPEDWGRPAEIEEEHDENPPFTSHRCSIWKWWRGSRVSAPLAVLITKSDPKLTWKAGLHQNLIWEAIGLFRLNVHAVNELIFQGWRKLRHGCIVPSNCRLPRLGLRITKAERFYLRVVFYLQRGRYRARHLQPFLPMDCSITCWLKW